MKIIEQPNISGLLILQPQSFEDERGYFFESYNFETFKKLGIDTVFVQDNQSFSKKNVVRGMHLQVPPFAQAKLVRVIKGAVLDVVVDVRKKSPNFGQHFSVILSEKNRFQFFIPVGFAHGFVALENETIFAYKCSEVYNKNAEKSILYNDLELNINWGIENPIVAERDLLAVSFRDFNSPF